MCGTPSFVKDRFVYFQLIQQPLFEKVQEQHQDNKTKIQRNVLQSHPAANGMMASANAHHPSSRTTPNGAAKQSTPGSASFFQGWKLRSGKWLEEEEAYAELLIDMFDRGLLSDCVTGSTLRAYLAQKLHCAPMRISKKFAGKGIGKKVYSCRMDSRKNLPASVAEQRRKLQQKTQEVEKAFHEAASCDAVSAFSFLCGCSFF